MSKSRWVLASLLALISLAASQITGLAQPAARDASTDATYFNDARAQGADPFVLYDEASGYYYAYSSEGADEGYHFGIYRSPDLATWEHVPGGALRAGAVGEWGHDWFWAPEVYYNDKTGVYFLFYSARMNEHVAKHFTYPDFEEPSKIGVAVSRSPAGPFTNIDAGPLNYYPYDPEYHDVNLIMDETQKKPPPTLAEGRTAPLGTYIPFIDPNVFFDDDGRIYLYFSRNAYRNWVWDDDLGKYIEESNIYAVELTSEWWNDPTGSTMPQIAPSYRNANRAPDDPGETRKDGFTPILNYASDKQAWENAHVNDYANTGGQKKDRRWAEGSTTIKRRAQAGRPVYFLTYSANNYENEYYGVGYAVADSPLGPWRKSADNPVLSQDPAQGLYSTGHGSPVHSPDGQQLYYVHHGRPSTSDDRSLYTARMQLDPTASRPSLSMHASTTDEPLPSGLAPLRLRLDDQVLVSRAGTPVTTRVWASSAGGAEFDLDNPLNRVTAELSPSSAGTARVDGDEVVVTMDRPGIATLRLGYQRQRADGSYVGVSNFRRDNGPGERGEPVAVSIPVTGVW